MIVLKLKLNKIFEFNDFEIDFTYPKKIVNSIIEEEHLSGRERFRYKKAVILMGANATGKTSLGRVLSIVFQSLEKRNSYTLREIMKEDGASLSIDFVNKGYRLHRFTARVVDGTNTLEYIYYSSEIEKMDSYEKCVRKLTDQTTLFKKHTNDEDLFGKINYRFSYPEIQNFLALKDVDKADLLKTFRAVIGTLDPSLQNIEIAKELKDSFIIRRKDQEIIIQEGKLLNRELLSSGTIGGIGVAIFLASMLSKEPCFYYCDEHFLYIQSNIEKRIFGIMLERIPNNGQLIFTTHNTDMLDLNLPKHTYVFLRRVYENGVSRVSAISASDSLKRNTDSVRSAEENDVFGALPNDYLLDSLETGWVE